VPLKITSFTSWFGGVCRYIIRGYQITGGFEGGEVMADQEKAKRPKAKVSVTVTSTGTLDLEKFIDVAMSLPSFHKSLA